MTLFSRAAERGYVDAMYRLGRLKVYGTGVPVDLEQGLAWMKKAADLGNANALATMGVIMSRKSVDGIARDVDAARRYLELAVEGGLKDAERLLARLDGGDNAASGWNRFGLPKDMVKRLNAGLLPEGAPAEDYKGFKLIGSWYKDANNEPFFRNAKKGIDMTKQFSKRDRDRIALIKNIVYFAPSKERKKGTYIDNKAGYIWDDTETPGYLFIAADMKMSAPYELATFLLISSLDAKIQKDLGDLNEALPDKDGLEAEKIKSRIAHLEAISSGTDIELISDLRCEVLKTKLRGYKAIKLDTTKISFVTSQLTSGRCW